MTIEYRVSPPLANETLNALFSIGWPTWQKAPDTSDWQPVLERSFVYICAFDGPRLIGFVNVAWDGRDHAFLLDTRVDPDFRMRGIGKELVARAAEAARSSGCEWVHVDYSPELRTFYEACGFKPTAAGLIHLGEHSPRMSSTDDGCALHVRPGREDDLADVAAMMEDFVKGHKAEHHHRPLAKLRSALFGDAPVAHLLVATRQGRIVGMVQWTLFFDMFWATYGARPEWLYVRREVRGLGVAAALIAEVCAQARRHGAEFLHGGGSDEVSRLYERSAIGSTTRECYLSAEAFQQLADLAGAPVREIVRRLPTPDLNRVPARPRT